MRRSGAALPVMTDQGGELWGRRNHRPVGYGEAFAAMWEAWGTGDRKRALAEKWQRAALRTKLKELEYSLKMQRKRVELLMLQMQAV